ncbi:MAG: 50S ribosomal protein L25 [Bacteroidetes bacterium]|nr:50S ribosomal protein L25 [Bacteroidota bacterium]
MKNVELIGTKRPAIGTSKAKAVRRNKQVPCVLYGGKEVLHFSVEERALNKIVHSPEAHYVELNIDGEKRQAVLQDKQFQPVTDAVIHADFLEAVAGKETSLNLAVRATGQSAGVRKGGKLNLNMRKLRVKGMPEKLPGVIEVDVANMDLGDSIHVSDLKLPGVTVMEKPSDVVVTVKMVKKAAETPAEAAPAAAAAAAPAAAAAGEKKAEPAPAKK